EAGTGRDVDDRTAVALAQHLSNLRAHAKPDTANVDVHGPIVERLILIDQLSGRALDARSIDGTIDPAKPRNCGLDRGSHLAAIGEIVRQRDCITTACLQRIESSLKTCRIPVDQRNAGAARRKSERNGPADAGSSTGDERHLAFEVHARQIRALIQSQTTSAA